LVRRPARNEDEVRWSPALTDIEQSALDGVDAVIHLAGEPILGRWTAAKRARIRESRVNGTGLLAEAMAAAARPPKIWISASAIGIYGDQGDTALTEEAAHGDDFLAEVCHAWEQMTAPARAAGVRVVNLRISMVLSPDGGALTKMLTPFRLGLGGRQGHGRQWVSWIAIEDLVRVIDFALTHAALSGPVNAAAPEPVRNVDFAKILGRVLRRPACLPLPGWLLKLLFGAVADATMLASARVHPAALQAAGFEFLWSPLESALSHQLAR
jgi:uncharacterized protein (TIGR01777 family)